jgi:hypothetical protein
MTPECPHSKRLGRDETATNKAEMRVRAQLVGTQLARYPAAKGGAATGER